jgi:hypothetical protein
MSASRPRYFKMARAEMVMAFLEQISQAPARRPRGSAGAVLRKYGWSDYLVRELATGEMKPLAEVTARAGPGAAVSRLVDYGERLEVITPEGREVLAKWKSGSKNLRLG